MVVVVDLEATCWSTEEDPGLSSRQRDECETLEIGAVKWSDGAEQSAFRGVIKPRRHPLLSAFCTRLTGLTQAEVDAAPAFPAVFGAFLAWAGPSPMVFASWGVFDDRLLRRDAGRWGLPEPEWFALNIKARFAKFAAENGAPRSGRLGLERALQHLGGSFSGTQHRALDDARNVAWLLDRLPVSPRGSGRTPDPKSTSGSR